MPVKSKKPYPNPRPYINVVLRDLSGILRIKCGGGYRVFRKSTNYHGK